jgi:hypothetical protein
VHGHWVRKPGRHQSESPPPPRQPPPPRPSPSPPPSQLPPRRRSKRRKLAIAATAAIAIGGGAATIDIATSGSSADASSAITVQANLSLKQVAAALEKLQLAGTYIAQPVASGCAQSATGAVRQFLALHPCKESAISSITMHKPGVVSQAAVSWVVMSTPTLAGQYKSIVDIPGMGNPPGESTAYNGLCYASGQSGETVWVAQIQPTGQVAADQKILQAVAPATLTQGYLNAHCTH